LLSYSLSLDSLFFYYGKRIESLYFIFTRRLFKWTLFGIRVRGKKGDIEVGLYDEQWPISIRDMPQPSLQENHNEMYTILRQMIPQFDKLEGASE
jgi:hypothetical protein